MIKHWVLGMGAAGLLLALSCGGVATSQTSSSSHWIQCDMDRDCAAVEGICEGGYCVDGDGQRIANDTLGLVQAAGSDAESNIAADLANGDCSFLDRYVVFPGGYCVADRCEQAQADALVHSYVATLDTTGLSANEVELFMACAVSWIDDKGLNPRQQSDVSILFTGTWDEVKPVFSVPEFHEPEAVCREEECDFCTTFAEEECDYNPFCTPLYGQLLNDSGCLKTPEFVGCAPYDAACVSSDSVQRDGDGACWWLDHSCSVDNFERDATCRDVNESPQPC